MNSRVHEEMEMGHPLSLHLHYILVGTEKLKASVAC